MAGYNKAVKQNTRNKPLTNAQVLSGGMLNRRKSYISSTSRIKTTMSRFVAIEKAVKEIKAKQKAKKPLLPSS
jgi:hypothetical protein